jgi:hypothetical protein
VSVTATRTAVDVVEVVVTDARRSLPAALETVRLGCGQGGCPSGASDVPGGTAAPPAAASQPSAQPVVALASAVALAVLVGAAFLRRRRRGGG